MTPQFKPGDTVVHKVALEGCRHYGSCPTPKLVVESHVVTCPGGVQVNYRLTNGALVNEIEIVPYDPEEIQQLLVQHKHEERTRWLRFVENEKESRKKDADK